MNNFISKNDARANILQSLIFEILIFEFSFLEFELSILIIKLYDQLYN